MSEERFPAARRGRRRGRPASRIQQVAVAILIAIAAIRRGQEDGMAAASLRFAQWKNSLSSGALTMTAAARAIRTPVNNRFDNEAIRSFVAKHCRRSGSAFEAVL